MKIQLDTERETIALDGVEITLSVLRTLANPDSSKFYQFQRDGFGVVTVQSYQLEGAASGFVH